MASHHNRINTLELKDLIYRRIGQERAEKYFNQLYNFLNLKLSKVELNKNCVQTIGRENIPLHNKLIRAIVQNSSQAKTPPPKSRRLEGLSVKVASGYQRSCLQSLYGDTFPQSSRRCRSPINRDRKSHDRPSPLGPLGKSLSLTCEETVTLLQEQQSASELHSLCSKPLLEDGEEVEQFDGRNNVQIWSRITAPHGVSVNKAEAIKAHQCDLAYGNSFETCQSKGELPDTTSLRSRLKTKLESAGLGISMDCANLLNNGLDVYLKMLIEPCINITGSRRTDRQCNNGKWSDNHVSGSNQPTRQKFVNMVDFRIAMESNPSILGVDWPSQLEKICHCAVEE